MRKLLPLLMLLVLMGGNTPRSPLLSNVERIEIDPWVTSCGLRTVEIGYDGATYLFDVTGLESVYAPEWWVFLGPTVMRVGTYGDEVLAVGPDGSLWRLVRAEEAALWCL